MCRFFGLREGTIVVVVFNEMHPVFAMTFGSIFLSLAQNKYDNSSERDSFQSYVQGKETEQNGNKELTIYGGLCVGSGIISLSIFICLMIGILKRKATLFIPWLVGCMIYNVLLVIFTIFFLNFGSMYTLVSSNLISLGLSIFQWIAVDHCYYNELRHADPNCRSSSADTPKVKQIQPKDNKSTVYCICDPKDSI